MMALLRPYATTIAAGVFFALSVYLLGSNLVANGKLSEAKAGRLKAETALAQCVADRSKLDAELKHQNLAIASLKAERDLAEQRGRKALQEAQRETSAARTRIAKLLSAKPVSDDYCEQARELEVFLRGAK